MADSVIQDYFCDTESTLHSVDAQIVNSSVKPQHRKIKFGITIELFGPWFAGSDKPIQVVAGQNVGLVTGSA